MKRLLIDTDVLFRLINAQPLGEFGTAAIQEAAERGEVAVSVISLLQFYEACRQGIIDAADLRRIEAWYSANRMQVVELDVDVLANLGPFAEVTRIADRLIIATARRFDFRLATLNTELTDAELEIIDCTED